MRLDFEPGERTQLAQRLGVDPNNEAALVAAVTERLKPQRRLEPRDLKYLDADDRLVGADDPDDFMVDDDPYTHSPYDGEPRHRALAAAAKARPTSTAPRAPTAQPGRVTFVGSGGTHNPTGRKGR